MSLIRLRDWEDNFKSSIDWSFLAFESVNSTMDVARDNINLTQLNKPLAIIAKEQFAGRGRQGRVWEESKGSLYITYAFKLDQKILDVSSFSLVVGVTIFEILKDFSEDLVLKWPNDILTREGRKVCGILIESFNKENCKYVLSGIGINLNGQVSGTADTTTLFRISGRTISPVEMVNLISDKLYSNWNFFVEHGFEVFRQKWINYSYPIGSFISGREGKSHILGEFIGIDKNGGLCLIVDGKERVLYS